MRIRSFVHVLRRLCRPAIALALAAILLAGLWSGCQMHRAALMPLPGRGALPDLRSISAPAVPEELWIVARPSETAPAEPVPPPGSGALLAMAEKEVPLPLRHTSVRASVDGYIGSVEVVQQFHNPYDSKIEAVYVFPLPHNSAVNEFVMAVGNRRIRGIIRERDEAEEIYRQARSQGYVASLLTEERPNVFRQSVANIEPGKQIVITIRYYHTLSYADGWYEFVFPMVVGPRFNPDGATGGIGAVARGQTGMSGQEVEVPYLNPSERSGHDISLQVAIDAGLAIEQFDCRTHQVHAEFLSHNRLSVTLDARDSIPNRDFVLRYRVAGERIKAGLLAHRDAASPEAGYFTLMLYPPRELGTLNRQPLELVFVLDCSGSMAGRPLEQARSAVERALQLLEPGDSFQIIDFSMAASQLGPHPLEVTPENVRRGLRYLRELQAGGGTMMITGTRAALDFPHDPARLRFVCFLTDGYIGNETEILGEIHQRLAASRIFSFGIGAAVNRYLIEQMAKAGRGAVAYVGSRDDAGKVMECFFERISHPALTDLKIDWGAMEVAELLPRQLPDLFVGRPVILAGRYHGRGSTPIRITGRAGGKQVDFPLPGIPDTSKTTRPALPNIWARMKMADLSGESVRSPNADWAGEMRKIALDYGLISAFTAFVAVDSTEKTAGNAGTVPVAVPVPEHVRPNTALPGHSEQ